MPARKPASNMDPGDIKMIVDRIKGERCRCVPFLGAGVNAKNDQHHYEGLPLGAELSRMLFENIKDKHPDLAYFNPKDLARVSLAFEYWRDRNYLVENVERCIPHHQRQPSPLLRLLARLPFRLIVTTNYDCLMEKALNDAGTKHEVIIQRKEGFKEDGNLFKHFQDLENYDGTILYKIHGSFFAQPNLNIDDSPPILITEDDYIQYLTVIGHENIGIPQCVRKQLCITVSFEITPQTPVMFHFYGFMAHAESLVLTENDYLEFLLAVSENYRIIPDPVLESLISSLLLSLGYSNDFSYRTLLKFIGRYIRYSRSGKNIQVFSPSPSSVKEEMKYLTNYYNQLRLRTYWATISEFAAELRQRWERYRDYYSVANSDQDIV